MKNIFKPFALLQLCLISLINFLFAQDKFPVKIIGVSSLTKPTLTLYDSSSQNSTRLQFQNAGSINFWQVKGYSSNTNTNSRVNFFYSDGGEIFTVTGDGKVGINNASPQAALDVHGQVKISGGEPGIGKVLTSDANGVATWSNAPTNTGFSVYSGGSAPQTLPSGVNVIMQFPTVITDDGKNYSNNTYTCPSEGFYHFDMQLTFKCLNTFTGDKQMYLGFFVNDSSVWKPSYALKYSAVDDVYNFTFSTRLKMGDRVTFRVTQNSEAEQRIVGGFFQGYRVY